MGMGLWLELVTVQKLPHCWDDWLLRLIGRLFSTARFFTSFDLEMFCCGLECKIWVHLLPSCHKAKNPEMTHSGKKKICLLSIANAKLLKFFLNEKNSISDFLPTFSVKWISISLRSGLLLVPYMMSVSVHGEPAAVLAGRKCICDVD